MTSGWSIPALRRTGIDLFPSLSWEKVPERSEGGGGVGGRKRRICGSSSPSRTHVVRSIHPPPQGEGTEQRCRCRAATTPPAHITSLPSAAAPLNCAAKRITSSAGHARPHSRHHAVYPVCVGHRACRAFRPPAA